MDQIGYSYTLSLSSSSYQQQYARKPLNPCQPSYHNSLHSVRKPLQKPTTKQFIAPLPPTPPKIYNIDPSNFKDMVRVLTTEPEFRYPTHRNLKDIAPPPLILSEIPKPSLFDLFPNPQPTNMISPDFSSKTRAYDPSEGAVVSPLGFGMSPTSLSWCSSVLNQSPIL